MTCAVVRIYKGINSIHKVNVIHAWFCIRKSYHYIVDSLGCCVQNVLNANKIGGHNWRDEMNAAELLLDSARGVYIPQNFVACFDLKRFGLPKHSDDWAIEICASGPDTEDYWEAWESILNEAEWHSEGRVWRLHHDGDLWAICYELMTDEEKQNFGFEDL